MLSATYSSDVFPSPVAAGAGGASTVSSSLVSQVCSKIIKVFNSLWYSLLLQVKTEPCSDDEEIEVGKESDMDEDGRGVSPRPVQDQPEDLSIKKEGRSVSSSSSRPSSISPPTRSTDSESPDSQKTGEQSRAKRIKPIPPPLDLNARTLSPSDTLPGTGLRSPSDADLPALPLRKRWVRGG